MESILLHEMGKAFVWSQILVHVAGILDPTFLGATILQIRRWPRLMKAPAQRASRPSKGGAIQAHVYTYVVCDHRQISFFCEINL